jgi:fatty acid desaturase
MQLVPLTSNSAEMSMLISEQLTRTIFFYSAIESLFLFTLIYLNEMCSSRVSEVVILRSRREPILHFIKIFFMAILSWNIVLLIPMSANEYAENVRYMIYVLVRILVSSIIF